MLILPALILLLQSIISVHTELVVVPAVVSDARGRRVSGLSRDNFQVLDNGRPQPVVAFNQGETSMTLGLVVDRSQSMRTRTEALFAVISRLALSANPGDELFAVNFNDHAALALPEDRPFTDNGGQLLAAIAAGRAEGQTALYDGVAAGLEHLRLGHGGRNALVVISDGGDNASTRNYADILMLARQSDAVIYAIGLLDGTAADEQEDGGLLKRLCKDTGGVAYFPTTPGEIVTAAAQIATDLREQYTLGFSPGGPAPPRTLHKITVTATDASRRRLHVRSRTGYITP